MTISDQDSAVSDLWELGVERIFGQHDIPQSVLVSGWSKVEDQHVWNDGIECVQTLVFRDPGRAITITLECMPFIRAHCTVQEVTLFVGGLRLGHWSLMRPDVHFLTATAPSNLLDIQNGIATLTCVWLLPNACRPAIAGDMRELALCFRAMTLS